MCKGLELGSSLVCVHMRICVSTCWEPVVMPEARRLLCGSVLPSTQL